jgi:hypothetical protein
LHSRHQCVGDDDEARDYYAPDRRARQAELTYGRRAVERLTPTALEDVRGRTRLLRPRASSAVWVLRRGDFGLAGGRVAAARALMPTRKRCGPVRGIAEVREARVPPDILPLRRSLTLGARREAPARSDNNLGRCRGSGFCPYPHAAGVLG